jgi:CRP/FNR family transcriptional regulator, cyclic AMP receptor protein
VVAILGPGHFFGEGCLNGHPLRIATTRAVDECVITRLEKATMIATIHNEPEFSELFMSYLCAPAIPPQLAKLMIDIASATTIRLILKRSKARSHEPSLPLQRALCRESHGPSPYIGEIAVIALGP